MLDLTKPYSIKEIGLEIFLNETRAMHNDKGYDEFLQCLDLEVPHATIARRFGVSRATMHKWVKIYKEQTK